jgi:hypothetical protein
MLIASRPMKKFMKMEEVPMDETEDMLLELEESGNILSNFLCFLHCVKKQFANLSLVSILVLIFKFFFIINLGAMEQWRLVLLNSKH